MRKNVNINPSPEERMAIGSTMLSYHRKQELNALEKVKEDNKKLKERGYVWVKTRKESRLVHPDKVEFFLEKGYKLSKL